MIKISKKKKKKWNNHMIVPFNGGFKYIALQLLWIY